MIGSLRGAVIYKKKEKIEVDLNGVGYEVYLTNRDLGRFKIGDDVELFTFHHLTEDTSDLFGFVNRNDKRVFEMLISVSGIGPKSALGILSIGNGERVVKAIAEADVEFFKQVKGIGSKSAQRVIVDLKAEVGSIKELDLEAEGGRNEIVYQALEGLGFRREEIRKALSEIPDEIEGDDERVKYTLKQLS